MKKKILAGVMLATMIFSLTACGSSEGNTTSGKNDSVATTEKKSDESKKILTDAGWKTETPVNLGLGLYLPNNDKIKVVYDYENDSYKDEDINEAWYGLGHDYANGVTLAEIRINSLGNSKVSADSIDFLISNTGYDLTLYSETDDYYLYELTSDEHFYRLFLYPKDLSSYYEISVEKCTFEDFTVSDYNTKGYSEPGASYKKGEFFTEETYRAFKDTITYLGK